MVHALSTAINSRELVSNRSFKFSKTEFPF